MNYLKYMTYIPFLIQLVQFIKDAQAKWQNPGSGQQKLTYVIQQFVPLVEQARAVGLVNGKLADAIISGAGPVISIIVQLMNVTGTMPEHGGTGTQPSTPPPTTAARFDYLTTLTSQPSNDDMKQGDEVWGYPYGTPSQWYVIPFHSPIPAAPPSGFVLLYTVTK